MRRRSFAWSALVVAAGLLGALAWATWPAIAPTVPSVQSQAGSQIAMRGQVVVALGDCMVCHTSKTGAARAWVKIGMMNLVYNMVRLVQLHKRDRRDASVAA